MYDFFWIRENILYSILPFYIVHIFQPRVFSVQGRGLPRTSNSHRVIKFTLSLSINSFDQFCLYLLTIQTYTVYSDCLLLLSIIIFSSGKLVQCWQRERSGVIIMEMRRMPIKLPTTVVSNCVFLKNIYDLKYLAWI